MTPDEHADALARRLAADVPAERERLAREDPEGERDAVVPLYPGRVYAEKLAAEIGVDLDEPPYYRTPKVRTPTAYEPAGIDAADLLELDLPPLRWIVP